jgi:hypothetical protein
MKRKQRVAELFKKPVNKTVAERLAEARSAQEAKKRLAEKWKK